MSSYASATVDFPNYGLPSTAVTGVSPALIQAHCDAASDHVDTFIQSRVGLPLATPYPASLVQKVCELAAYSVLTIIGFNPANPNDAAVLQRRDAALKYFDEIKEGRITPTFANVQPAAQVSSDQPRGWYQPFNVVLPSDGTNAIT